MDVSMSGAARFTAQKEILSPLMQAKHSQQAAGRVANLCPFGCKDHQLDDNGYCVHLIGFTEDKQTYEPMVRRQGRRVVQVPREKILTGDRNDDGEPDYEWGEPRPPECPKNARFVRITTCFRVYVEKPVDAKVPAKG